MKIEVVGVYAVRAEEPCHLIEIEVSDCTSQIDFLQFTQPLDDQPRDNWQVPYDEAFLDAEGIRLVDEDDQYKQPSVPRFRAAFYFHYLDQKQPLQSQVGPLKLPKTTKKPRRLAFLRYESP